MTSQVNIYVPKDKMEVIKKAKDVYGGSLSSLVVLLIERYVKSYEEEECKNECSSTDGDKPVQ